MCELRVEGTKGIVDLSKCPFEFGSPEFINYHLKNLVSIVNEKPINELIYEEEITFTLPPQGTKTLIEYAKVLAQIEAISLKEEIYGHPSDPQHNRRIEILKKFLKYAYMNPVSAARMLEEYKEPTPDKAVFMKGYQVFKGWLAGILKTFKKTKLYQLVEKTGDLRNAFLSLVGLHSLYFVNVVALELPKTAVPLKDPKARYKLDFGLEVQIYEVPERDMYIYYLRNPILEGLSKELKKMLKELITAEMRESFTNADYSILFNLKVNEYKSYFMESAILNNIRITPKEALIMAREAASWVVGLGSPIENIALDSENVTDIYIDSENSPLYLDHREFGIVHTLFRYNRELLERAFRNMVFSEKGKKFDTNNPVVDVVVKRLNMRCHLQRPPATFEELQGALRIMSEEPFTYAQYLFFKSFTPFFAGYDDVMVTLGSSEAVLGIKGSGKTSFTAAKIAAIGPGKRIIPIQDIWEIPVRAYRKRGFHIGAAKVASADYEGQYKGGAMDLVSMANALLRMGDAALIINEVRSRLAVQGIINLLNTQPGVFLLYNLHAESLDDIRDRLELVFGIPAASMFATDRYTFLKKIQYGRKGKTHRVLGYEYESDRANKKFVKIFEFDRGKSIETSTIKALFINNEIASSRDFSKLDLKELSKEIEISFVPPALSRRSADTGISAEQYILQAFYKGKVFYDIYKASMDTGAKELLYLDFFLKANTLANKILVELEGETGEVDFGEAQRRWLVEFKPLVKKELQLLKVNR